MFPLLHHHSKHLFLIDHQNRLILSHIDLSEPIDVPAECETHLLTGKKICVTENTIVGHMTSNMMMIVEITYGATLTQQFFTN